MLESVGPMMLSRIMPRLKIKLKYLLKSLMLHLVLVRSDTPKRDGSFQAKFSIRRCLAGYFASNIVLQVFRFCYKFNNTTFDNNPHPPLTPPEMRFTRFESETVHWLTA